MFDPVRTARHPRTEEGGPINPTPSILVFDVNETLLAIDSLAPLFGDVFGDRRVLREWFNQLVLYSMTATLSEHYVDFFTLGPSVLRMLGAIHDVTVTDDDIERLREGFRTMPPHPDVVDGLNRLRDDGLRLVSLTNSPHRPGTPTPLENAGLADFFEQQFSVDASHAFKPAPVVYRHACQELGVSPTDCMMVAAHHWDLLGARNAGFGTALITRPGNAPVGALPQPDIIAKDLAELAARLRRDG
ncbi:haloacid dehalogenase type II [Mycobacterium asiaticum]|uniref:haloacid dehalogenase type II n=1 Tax=Mycobacterium asiaticum TaxID=1790 RepID=UPI0009BCD30F|nr:haloacid dehalogenase type II [Mycobacterium asiaticum]